MPDNKNPPKNNQPPKPKDEEEKIGRVGETIPCDYPGCKKPALSLSSYCWEHIEDKEAYRRKVQEWHWARKSMERFIINDADLSGLELIGEVLSKAWLFKTNLSNANLAQAKLINAQLIGTELPGASLISSNLSEARLMGAVLTNAKLNWAKLTGAIGLTNENFSEELTDEEKKDAFAFKESYLTVKNYFIQNGLYDDASWAAFRERTLERIAWYNAIKKMGLLKSLRYRDWRKTVFRWFGSKVISLLNGYGEKPLRAVISSVVIVIGFFIFYFISKCIQAYPDEVLHWWDYLYFSIVTFTTLGYGDIRPFAVPWARMVASLEAFMGAFMIALFVLTLARRYVAR